MNSLYNGSRHICSTHVRVRVGSMDNFAEKNHLSHHKIIYLSILLLPLFLFTRSKTDNGRARSLNLLFLTSLSYTAGIFYSFQHKLKKLVNTRLINVLFLCVGWIAYQIGLQINLRLQGGLSFYAIGTKFEFINTIRPEIIASLLIVSGIASYLRIWYKHKQKKSLVNTHIRLHIPAHTAN